MIYVFNETDQPQWNVIDKNASFLHIGSPYSFFGIDILKNNTGLADYTMDILNVTNSKNLQIASTLAFSVFTNNKSGYPSLKPIDAPNEYSSDLYLISYKLDAGLQVIKEKANKFTIQYIQPDYQHGVLNIIATGKPVFKPSYFITLSDKDRTKYITKDLVTNAETSIVTIYIKNYTKAEAEASSHKKYILEESKYEMLKPAKSRKPYSIIVYPFSKPEIQDVCTNDYHRHPDHTIYLNSEDKNLYSLLKQKRTDKFNAVTFYITKTVEQVKTEGIPQLKLARLFHNVNYLTSDMKIVF